MGIEKDIKSIIQAQGAMYIELRGITHKLDKLLAQLKEAKLWEEKGKDKAIKDSLKEKLKCPNCEDEDYDGVGCVECGYPTIAS